MGIARLATAFDDFRRCVIAHPAASWNTAATDRSRARRVRVSASIAALVAALAPSARRPKD
jgi:hypothetical protein